MWMWSKRNKQLRFNFAGTRISLLPANPGEPSSLARSERGYTANGNRRAKPAVCRFFLLGAQQHRGFISGCGYSGLQDLRLPPAIHSNSEFALNLEKASLRLDDQRPFFNMIDNKHILRDDLSMSQASVCLEQAFKLGSVSMATECSN